MHLPVLLAMALLAPAQPSAEAEPPVRLVLVRHAEAAPDSADPGLTAQGSLRARCLVDALAGHGVTHVVTSSWRRTRETVGPLASARKLEALVRDPMDGTALATELGSLPAGSVAVIAGHSNTLPLLAKALGVQLSGLVEEQGQPALPRAEHDRMVIVELRAGEGAPSDRVTNVEERRFTCATAVP